MRISDWSSDVCSSDLEPVPVSFRSLVPEMNATERATHLIHPYPAKLLRHIPFLFLASQEVCRSSGAVLDPFCGSGTVLLESALSGRVGQIGRASCRERGCQYV